MTERRQKSIKIKEGIESWVNRFRANLFAFDYNIDSPSIKVDKNLSEICGFFYLHSQNGTPLNAFKKDMDNVKVFLSDPINIKLFKHTLKATSDNKQLLLEFQLLKEAHQSLQTDNYRKSILDSASALELSLTNAIKRELKIDEKLLDEILKMNNSIAKKIALIKFTRQKLPEYNFKKDIEDLRNKAIHIGKTPTEEEASKAYKIVKAVLEKLTIDKFE